MILQNTGRRAGEGGGEVCVLQMSPGGTWCCLALRAGMFQKLDGTVIPEPFNLRAQSCYWTSAPVSGELLVGCQGSLST